MPTATMTQTQPVFGSFLPLIQGTPTFKDSAGVITETGVFISFNTPTGVDTIKFNQWSTNPASFDSLVTTQDGAYLDYTITFHGTGNLTGHGNDDTFNGTITGVLHFSGERGHQEAIFYSASMALTYTD